MGHCEVKMTAGLREHGICGVVLAGGRAERMGGRDKGLLPLGGRPLITHVLERLAPQVDAILINANRSAEAYRKLGWPVIRDDLEGFQGPLAGMLAGLRASVSRRVVTCPCDSPWLAGDYVARMAEAAQQHRADIAVAALGGRWQPVFALLGVDLAPDLAASLAAGERKIDRWFALHRVAVVDFDDRPAMFENLNTPEELRAAEAAFRSGAQPGGARPSR